MRKLVFILTIIFTGFYSYCQERSVLIAAASDTKFALDSIITRFERLHPGCQIDVTYGSSGKLYEQILHSAPFDLFFSADIDYPISLKEKGMTSSDVLPYGVGRIAIWTRMIEPSSLNVNALTHQSVDKIAIANPRHAPYGRRAEEALKYYNIYDKVKSKLVYGENVSQAAQFLTAGAAEAGIIALSLVRSPTMTKFRGSFFVIPEEAHRPLLQGFVILRHGGENDLARAFKDFMLTSAAVDILAHFGFAQKGNPSAHD
jgi:molybdate transport system substrate-binding protein